MKYSFSPCLLTGRKKSAAGSYKFGMASCSEMPLVSEANATVKQNWKCSAFSYACLMTVDWCTMQQSTIWLHDSCIGWIVTATFCRTQGTKVASRGTCTACLELPVTAIALKEESRLCVRFFIHYCFACCLFHSWGNSASSKSFASEEIGAWQGPQAIRYQCKCNFYFLNLFFIIQLHGLF